MQALAIVVLALGLASSSAATDQKNAVSDTPAAARALIPLLESVRERLRPHIGIGVGTLPPSPFTGTRTALFAVRIGTETVDVDPKVVAALDRLLAWNVAATPAGPEAVLFDHWLDQLKLKATVLRDPRSTEVQCDTACVIERFTHLDQAVGESRKEREELRDRLLLEALIAAVE